MNKPELCMALAKKTGFSKKDTERITGAFIETITEALKQGSKVQITGFGTFVVKDRAAHKGRNPHTGEEVEVAASKAPVFKAGNALKSSLK